MCLSKWISPWTITWCVHVYIYMDVSENSGTPKSSILIGFSIINHPFWGTRVFGNTHIHMFHVVWIVWKDVRCELQFVCLCEKLMCAVRFTESTISNQIDTTLSYFTSGVLLELWLCLLVSLVPNTHNHYTELPQMGWSQWTGYPNQQYKNTHRIMVSWSNLWSQLLQSLTLIRRTVSTCTWGNILLSADGFPKHNK